MSLNDIQLERYARQIVLNGVGVSGQEKLLASKVLVVGAGGLGCTVLSYLVASGIGTIGVIDYDKVELSNLHRQILHFTDDINKSKILSVKQKLNKINPDVEIKTYDYKLEKSNIEEIFSEYEIIVDGLDNFKDKFLVNDYSVLLNKKMVHAGVTGFEGQILTVIPQKSACLRCYFPEELPDNLKQNCKEIGVVGSTVGVIGSMQANEVIKLILGIGKPLTNRILKFNALESSFYEFKIQRKNNNCPICREITCNILQM